MILRVVVRRLAVATLIAAAVAGCGNAAQNPPAARNSAQLPGTLNGVSAADVLAAINRAQLPALNPRDATASTCPSAGCLEAEVTDTVSILKFPSTGRAELYAATIRDMVQVEDIVLVFDAAVGDPQKQAYGRVVKTVVAGR